MPANRAATNTTTSYGWVERAFHWAIAGLIALNLALGVVAEEWAYDTGAALATKATLFSLHKTVGVTILFVALARIAWALSQPRPAPLHAGWEARLAGAVHWSLYASLVAVPLLGWAQHSAETGFAPILWPLGQSLPFVPKDAALASTLATLHVTFVIVLAASLALHVAGAIKHAVVDRDATLARMLRGAEPGAVAAGGGRALPIVAAAAVWGAALAVGIAVAPGREAAATVAVAPVQAEEPVAGAFPGWSVEAGTLSITVRQMGADVTGSFADWSARIGFDEATGTGDVTVEVATGSLALGSVSAQAAAPEFLSSEAFPTATYEAAIRPEGDGYVADGTLSLRGVTIDLPLAFALDLEDGVATMEGRAMLDRRDFGMGEAYPDEASVGFAVTLDVALTARRDAGS